MKAKTMEGRDIDLQQETINNLKARLRGEVLIPGDAGYDESRTVWNAMIERRPAFVVRCLGCAPTWWPVCGSRVKTIFCSASRAVDTTSRGLATADGAMMLDMSRMRGVWVDHQKKIAHAQAGCLLGDVDRETQAYGLATILGYVSPTGIAGLTTGRWIWLSDKALGLDNGQHCRDEHRHRRRWARPRQQRRECRPLLGAARRWWEFRGRHRHRLHALPGRSGDRRRGCGLARQRGPGVLELYRELAEKAPPELTLVLLMRPAPPAPWLPKEVHAKPIVAIVACYSGRPEESQAWVAPIKSHGKPVGDILVRRPYVQMQSLFDATQPKGRRYYWKSEYLPRIQPALCEKVIAHAARIRSPYSSVILFQIGGALNRMNEEHSPVGNRDAHYVLNIGSSWEHGGRR